MHVTAREHIMPLQGTSTWCGIHPAYILARVGNYSGISTLGPSEHCFIASKHLRCFSSRRSGRNLCHILFGFDEIRGAFGLWITVLDKVWSNFFNTNLHVPFFSASIPSVIYKRSENGRESLLLYPRTASLSLSCLLVVSMHHLSLRLHYRHHPSLARRGTLRLLPLHGSIPHRYPTAGTYLRPLATLRTMSSSSTTTHTSPTA